MKKPTLALLAGVLTLLLALGACSGGADGQDADYDALVDQAIAAYIDGQGTPLPTAALSPTPPRLVPPSPTHAPIAAPAPTDASQAPRGNSTGNIVNGGIAAFDGYDLIVFNTFDGNFVNLYGDYVYYVNQKDGGRLYRQPLESGNAACICTATDIAYVNIVDDYIFYRSTDDKYSVRRMELDGSNDVRLTAMRASRLTAVDGYLYYANWDDGTEGLWRMDYEGQNQTRLYKRQVPIGKI